MTGVTPASDVDGYHNTGRVVYAFKKRASDPLAFAIARLFRAEQRIKTRDKQWFDTGSMTSIALGVLEFGASV
jgi:hypothetical protein